MRVMGFSKKWDKLNQPEFTTFRFPRKDKDWQIGEQVQVVYKPRSKDREVLGIAEIKNSEPRSPVKLAPIKGLPPISDTEAEIDGFKGKNNRYGVWVSPYFIMWEWLWEVYGVRRLMSEHLNKLTLRWVNKLGSKGE